MHTLAELDEFVSSLDCAQILTTDQRAPGPGPAALGRSEKVQRASVVSTVRSAEGLCSERACDPAKDGADGGDVPFRASPTLETMWTSSRFDLDDYRFEKAGVY